MFKVCVLLIVALSTTFGHTLMISASYTLEQKYVEAESKSIETLVAEVNQNYVIVVQKGVLKYGDTLLSNGSKTTRSPNGALSLISTTFTYPGPRKVNYIHVRIVQSSPKHLVRVTRMTNNGVVITVQSFETTLQDVVVSIYGK